LSKKSVTNYHWKQWRSYRLCCPRNAGANGRGSLSLLGEKVVSLFSSSTDHLMLIKTYIATGSTDPAMRVGEPTGPKVVP